MCYISVETYGNHQMHDIQTNNSWIKCPYENYYLVPEDMVQDIMKTKGFCDIVVEDGVVVSFIAREIPEPETEPENNLSLEERVANLEVAIQQGLDLYEGDIDNG